MSRPYRKHGGGKSNYIVLTGPTNNCCLFERKNIFYHNISHMQLKFLLSPLPRGSLFHKGNFSRVASTVILIILTTLMCKYTVLTKLFS